jgi:hypothetical protein
LSSIYHEFKIVDGSLSTASPIDLFKKKVYQMLEWTAYWEAPPEIPIWEQFPEPGIFIGILCKPS